MKVENNHINLRVITFDDNEKNLKDKFDRYHIGKNIYDISNDTIKKLTNPKPKTIYIKQNEGDYKLY